MKKDYSCLHNGSLINVNLITMAAITTTAISMTTVPFESQWQQIIGIVIAETELLSCFLSTKCWMTHRLPTHNNSSNATANGSNANASQWQQSQ